MDARKFDTQIGDVAGSNVIIGSEHVVAKVEQTVTNQPVDEVAKTLMTLIQQHLTSDVADVAKGMVEQATAESKKPDKNSSKIKGFIATISALLRGADEAAKVIEVVDEWTGLLGS